MQRVLWALAVLLLSSTVQAQVVGGGGGGTSGDVTSNNEDIATEETLTAVVTAIQNQTTALSDDAQHDNTAQPTGPQMLAECDDTSTDAVDEGDAAKIRVDCTTREVLAKVTANNLDVQSGGADLATASAQTAGNTSLSNIVTDTSVIAGDTTDIETAVEGCSGATTVAVASAASTNSTSVKASAGNLCGITLVNTTATLYYLRLYNLAAGPTCSSATGYIATLPIPASTSGAGFVTNIPFGAAYSTGIAYCITGGASSTDNTNAATGIYGMVLYK